ncbi:hypothetical protein CSKR_106858 [Clonorchis sinensis]|uniref:Uncharacterized protein n=1 Tax=Clonorchis sinensis TaxID=79923 RepID=A0A419PUI0_CLOSI|nr:hypothetical protein CSKR_106858 [Clonorchis sinensis]
MLQLEFTAWIIPLSALRGVDCNEPTCFLKAASTRSSGTQDKIISAPIEFSEELLFQKVYLKTSENADLNRSTSIISELASKQSGIALAHKPIVMLSKQHSKL